MKIRASWFAVAVLAVGAVGCAADPNDALGASTDTVAAPAGDSTATDATFAPNGESADVLAIDNSFSPEVLTIVAGNEPPAISVDIPGNRTFYFPGQPLKYAVAVKDKEDGVAPDDRVAFSIDRVADTFDVSWLAQGDAAVDAGTRFAVAKALINQSDCKTCHNVDSKSQGPAWTEIAAKYATDAPAQAKLVDKIRAGGTGVWGQSNMPAHPGLTVDEAQAILAYVMNIKSTAINATPLAGTYAPTGGATAGQVIFRAVYTDKGVAGPTPLLSHTVERVAVRRSPVVRAVAADPSFPKRDWSAMRGGRLHELLPGVKPRNHFANNMGMTETCGTIVYLPPEDHDPAGNPRMRAAGLGCVCQPGVGLSGMRFTWARSRFAMPARRRACPSESFSPSIIAHSIDGRRFVRTRHDCTASSSSASG